MTEEEMRKVREVFNALNEIAGQPVSFTFTKEEIEMLKKISLRLSGASCVCCGDQHNEDCILGLGEEKDYECNCGYACICRKEDDE